MPFCCFTKSTSKPCFILRQQPISGEADFENSKGEKVRASRNSRNFGLGRWIVNIFKMDRFSRRGSDRVGGAGGGGFHFHRHSSSDQESEASLQDQSHAPPKMVYPSKCLNKILSKVSVEGRQKLQNYEFYPNWMCLPNEIVLHDTEVEGIISYLKNFANEMLPRDDSERQLKTYGLAPIMCNNALAFMMILQNDYVLADDCITESNRLIDICFNAKTELLHQDYLKGMFYVVKGLKILLESFTGSMGEEFNFQEFLLEAVENFRDLPEKAQVAVLASKHFFLKLINRRKGQIKYPDISEIVSRDPDFFEWRIYQYLYARQSRCQMLGDDASPSEIEIQSIQAACTLAPFNPYCVVYLCQCLAEQLRNFSWTDSDQYGLNCGQWYFATEEQAVACVKDLCSKTIKANQQSVKINLIVADIMGTLLPFKHRDMFQARECVFNAFRFGKDVSSQANHRLALWLLQSVKTPASNPIACKELLEKAFELNNRNTAALFQLFQVHLHQPKACYHNIRLLFATHMSNVDFPEEFVRKLIFLKGCFHMLIGESENAILTWMSVYGTHRARIDFSMLRTYSYIFRVYQWSRELLNLPTIISATNEYFASIDSPPTSPALNDNPTLRQTKSILMEMMQDQYQSLNSDEFYKLQMARSNQVGRPFETFPAHYRQLSSSSSLPDVEDNVEDDDVFEAEVEEMEFINLPGVLDR